MNTFQKLEVLFDAQLLVWKFMMVIAVFWDRATGRAAVVCLHRGGRLHGWTCPQPASLRDMFESDCTVLHEIVTEFQRMTVAH